jgi:hypothetical protein
LRPQPLIGEPGNGGEADPNIAAMVHVPLLLPSDNAYGWQLGNPHCFGKVIRGATDLAMSSSELNHGAGSS